ncbi:carbonic anhydrase [Lipomyces kononenkoae]|uniref:Carbonic anhydrase n=1 Tax=Lipomyces kononenkoae TaxID=34357 RepID=A0ACC3SWN2_LIPKO
MRVCSSFINRLGRRSRNYFSFRRPTLPRGSGSVIITPSLRREIRSWSRCLSFTTPTTTSQLTRLLLRPLSTNQQRRSQCGMSDSNTFFSQLLQRNAAWADRVGTANPDLFPRNAKGQSPQILWIGCSDSRAGDGCLDLLPGEVFVHRNIANLLPYNDLSSLSVVQFAVDVLKVKHIVICGHYDCGGVIASLGSKRLGLLDNWLRNLRDVRAKHKAELDQITDFHDKVNRFVELNVIHQVHNLKKMVPVLDALNEGRIQVHGVVYDVATGRLKSLDVPDDPNAQDYIVFDSHHTLE